MAQNIHKIKLKDKKTIARNTLELIFSKPADFDFVPGQFVQFEIPHTQASVMRAYSIASIPADSDIKFCVKVHENGIASKYFRNMKPGQELNITGPSGKFIFINAQIKTHYFIATGVGLAPIVSIIQDRLNKQTDLTNQYRLLFGLRHEDNIFYVALLDRLADQHANFIYQLTLSQPSNKWQGLTGRVTEHLPKEVDASQFYLCGSLEMVKGVREKLLKKGVSPKQILFEAF